MLCAISTVLASQLSRSGICPKYTSGLIWVVQFLYPWEYEDLGRNEGWLTPLTQEAVILRAGNPRARCLWKSHLLAKIISVTSPWQNDLSEVALRYFSPASKCDLGPSNPPNTRS